MGLWLLLILLGEASPVRASIPVHFYRSAQSFFPSGSQSLKELNETKIRSESQFSLLAQHKGSPIWLSPQQVVRDIQLAEYVYSPEKNEKFRIIKTQGAWALGERKDKKQEWLNIYQIVPEQTDKGLVYLLTPSPLRKSPSWKADSSLTLPAGSVAKLIDVEGTWARVKFNSIGSQEGYLELSQVLLKHDFASFALVQKQWRAVQHRNLNQLVIDHNQTVPLKEVDALMTRSELAIAVQTMDEPGIKIRNQFVIEKVSADIWNVSHLQQHGEVFWKTPETTRPNNSLTLDQLLKRSVHNVAIHPKNPNMSLVSANGIFFSNNNRIWNQISQFNQQDLPVAIAPNGDLYVGHFRSRDQGKTFRPYMSWEHMIRHTLSANRIKNLRFSRIDFPNTRLIQVELEVNSKKISLWSPLDQDVIRHWNQKN